MLVECPFCSKEYDLPNKGAVCPFCNKDRDTYSESDTPKVSLTTKITNFLFRE